MLVFVLLCLQITLSGELVATIRVLGAPADQASG